MVLKLTIVCIILIILCILWVRSNKKGFDREKMVNIFLTGLGGLALVIAIYDKMESDKKEDETRRKMIDMQQVKFQHENFINPMHFILQYYPESTNIFYELFYTQDDIPKNDAKIDPIKRSMVEEIVSLKIMQNAENFVLTHKELDYDSKKEVVNILLFWFTSQLLQHYLKTKSFMYDKETIRFLKHLIDYSNKLHTILKKEKNDERINEIINSFSEEIINKYLI
jgi:hypothetical protein